MYYTLHVYNMGGAIIVKFSIKLQWDILRPRLLGLLNVASELISIDERDN